MVHDIHNTQYDIQNCITKSFNCRNLVFTLKGEAEEPALSLPKGSGQRKKILRGACP